MSGLFGEFIAASVRTGDRIGRSAAGQQHRISMVFLPIGAQNAGDFFIRCQQLFDRSLLQMYASFFHLPHQRFQNIRCLIRHRKNTVAALGLERNACIFKKRHCILGIKPRKCRIQKPRILRDIGKQRLPIAVIGDIAASLAGNQQLSSRLFPTFQQQHAFSKPSGLYRRHHPGSTAADYNQIIFQSHRSLSPSET